MADTHVQIKSISTSGLHPIMLESTPNTNGNNISSSHMSARDRELMENSCSSLQFISDAAAFANMDETSYESVSTSAILRYCKMKVLKPYFRLLSILGWRPLISQNTLFENACWARLFNCTYVILILSLIVTGYVLQYSSCYRQDGYRPYADPPIVNPDDEAENNSRAACYHSLVRADGLHASDYRLLLAGKRLRQTATRQRDGDILSRLIHSLLRVINNEGDAREKESSLLHEEESISSKNNTRRRRKNQEQLSERSNRRGTGVMPSSGSNESRRRGPGAGLGSNDFETSSERDEEDDTLLDPDSKTKEEDNEPPGSQDVTPVTPYGLNALPQDHHCIPKCRGNFFALYLVPNVLHFLAYLSVWYLMRTPESEKLENLMERGFLQTTRTTGWMMAHKKLVSSLRRIIWMCLIWLILSAGIHGLIVGSRISDLNLTWLKYGEPIKSLLIALTLAALTFNDLICGAIVTSYTVHCQLNISYIFNLCASIREKRIEFQEFYKRIEEAKKFLDYLNNEQALGLSLLLITIGCKLSTGVYALLASGEFNHWSAYAIAIVLMSLLFWSSLFAVPIIQSIRLTAACADLKKIGHEIRARPFGYQDADQSDLDSLLLYTTNLSMNARILRVPVTSPCILIILILFLIVILMFGQLGLLNV